jgi:hypothetical protein
MRKAGAIDRDLCLTNCVRSRVPGRGCLPHVWRFARPVAHDRSAWRLTFAFCGWRLCHHSVAMNATDRRHLVPVLYVGSSASRRRGEVLRARGFGVIVADTPMRAFRLLRHFRVDAIVVVQRHAEPARLAGIIRAVAIRSRWRDAA